MALARRRLVLYINLHTRPRSAPRTLRHTTPRHDNATPRQPVRLADRSSPSRLASPPENNNNNKLQPPNRPHHMPRRRSLASHCIASFVSCAFLQPRSAQLSKWREAPPALIRSGDDAHPKGFALTPMMVHPTLTLFPSQLGEPASGLPPHRPHTPLPLRSLHVTQPEATRP